MNVSLYNIHAVQSACNEINGRKSLIIFSHFYWSHLSIACLWEHSIF